MSNGNFQLIGDVYENVYISNKNTSDYADLEELNNEILASINSTVNFSDYDNWTNTSNYNHSNDSDGNVDKIIIIYRNNDMLDGRFTGSARFYIDDVTYDGVNINSGFESGSGVQLRGGSVGLNFTKYIAAHELGHHLFGNGHLGPIARLGLMISSGYAWNAHRGMCSWERERLGWIDYDEIGTVNSINITLSDYMTTGDVVKVNVGTSGQEFFLFENRQKISPHDQAGDIGLYIFHVKNGLYSIANIDVECADGNWNFNYDQTNQRITRSSPNTSGYDEINYHVKDISTGDYVFCFEPFYPENSCWGDNEDAFSMDFNPVFTPYSNPSSINTPNDLFSLEIYNENSGLIQANINFVDPDIHAPSHPMNFLSQLSNVYPSLSWHPFSEPDFAYYEVWKKNTPTGSWFLYTTTTDNYYVDDNNQYTEVSYKIRAVDMDNNYSTFTDEQSLSPGIISENTTWSGSFAIKHNITIQNNATLSIIPGANISILPNKKIMVNGSINAIGTYTGRIVFNRSGTSGTWSGFEFSNTSEGDFEYVDIKNAMTGLLLNNTSLDIQKTKFMNCPIAIDCESLSSITLTECEITGSEVIGVYLGFGSTLACEYSLFDNAPYTNYSYGIITLGDMYALYCQITNAGTGIVVAEDCWADLGDENTEETGFNNIFGNTDYDIEAYEDILAQINYWGGDEPENFAGSGDVEYDPWLDEPDGGNPYDGANKSAAPSKFATPDYIIFTEGRSFELKNQYENACKSYEEVVSKYPESFFASHSLQHWVKLKFKMKSENEILTYIEKQKNCKSTLLADNASKLEVLVQRKIGNYNTALSIINKSYNSAKSDSYNSFFKYQEGIIYQYDLADVIQATTIFTSYLKTYPKDDRNSVVIKHLQSITSSAEDYIKNSNTKHSYDAEYVSETIFELHDNYPNPFNPSTNIKFSLAEASHVTIEIFNVLGQKVRTFNRASLDKGLHQITWDGRNELGSEVTSGLYIMRFTAKSANQTYNAVNRMLLIR